MNKQELTYIDNLAKEKLGTFAIDPQTRFENLNFSNGKNTGVAIKSSAIKLKLSHLIFSAITAIITLTAIIVINTDNKKLISPKATEYKAKQVEAKKPIPVNDNKIIFNKNTSSNNTTVIIKKRIIVKDTIYIEKN